MNGEPVRVGLWGQAMDKGPKKPIPSQFISMRTLGLKREGE